MADTDEYEPCETIWEFLQLKGSVRLLTLLYDRPRMFSELESEMEITSSTISRRRTDADDLGLLTVELESGEHGTKHVYTLTDMGEYLARRMAREGITTSYHKMREHQQVIEEKTKEIVDWVGDSESDFLQFNAAQENRVKPREDTGLPPELEKVRAAKEESDEKSDTGTGDDDDEETDADEAGDQPETGGESSDRPQSPSDRIPDDAGGSSEHETQGTFEDIAADATESGEADNEPDS